MVISRLIVAEFFADPLFRLTETTRPYFLQSRPLFLACRRLPEPPSDATAQIKDLRKLFKEIEHVLYLGTIVSRDHQIETNEAFRAADEHLRDYIAKYNVALALAPDTDEVKGQVIQPWKETSNKDRIAGSWIKKPKVLTGAKNITLCIFLWPKKPREQKNGKWYYTPHNVEVETERSDSLNVLLLKLFWASAMGRTTHISLSLKQNPQFYPKFPYEKEDFLMLFQVSNSRSDVLPCIPALCGWDPVERYKGSVLHLIVDRDRSDMEVELKDFSKLHLPEIYSNGWYLEKDLIVVREKGSHNLLLWNVNQPPVPSVNDPGPSTATLVEVPGLASGSSIEELNEELELFAASTEPLIPKMPQVGPPIHSDPSPVYANPERNIATGSQHGNRTLSIRDLPEPSKENAVLQDQTEDAGTPTLTPQEIEERLVLSRRIQELRENGVQGNFHSSPQYGAAYFTQPYINSDAAAHHISTLTPEYKMPWMFVTHHHHYYNALNVSPPSIINNINNINSGNMNNTNMNNTNISNDSPSPESGDDEGEPYFLNGWLSVDIDFTRNDDKHDRQRDARGV